MVERLTKSATDTAKVKPIGWHDHPFFYRMVKGDLNGILMRFQYIWSLEKSVNHYFHLLASFENTTGFRMFAKYCFLWKIYSNLCAKLLWCRCGQVSRNSDTKSFTATASSPSWLKRKKGCEELYIKVLSVCYFSRARHLWQCKMLRF